MTSEQTNSLSNVLPKSSVTTLGKAALSQGLPEIEVFQHINFNFQTETFELQPGEKERHTDRGNFRTTFDVDLTGHPLDKNISAIIVYSGYWQFLDSDKNVLGSTLSPGHYARVADLNIPNDKISSFKSVEDPNTQSNAELATEIRTMSQNLLKLASKLDM